MRRPNRWLDQSIGERFDLQLRFQVAVQKVLDTSPTRWWLRVLLAAVAVARFHGQIVLAEITLPAVLGSHMVLQRDQPVPVWGWAAPNEESFVRFAGAFCETQADESGRWRVTLPRLTSSSQSQSMSIESSGGQIEMSSPECAVTIRFH